MEPKISNTVLYSAGGLALAYGLYRLFNKGFSFAAKYPRLYQVVVKGESKTYNDYNFYTTGDRLKGNVNGKGSKYGPLDRPLTLYTVGQIKKMQANPRNSVGQLFATGRYQIIPTTLIGLQKSTGISDSALYGKVTQDRLINAIIKDYRALRNYLNKSVPDTDDNLRAAALDVAKIWSSVGTPGTDSSYYAPRERATTSTLDVQKALRSYR